MCGNEGKLMAYLDRQLAPREMARAEAHVGRCPRCRRLLESMRAERDEVGGLLESYRAAAEGRPEAESEARRMPALAGKGGRLAGGDPGGRMAPKGLFPKGLFSKEKGVVWMRGYRKVLAGVAAVALAVGLFSYAPVRGFASQILQVFRVNRVQILRFDPRDVQELERALETYGHQVDVASFGEVKREWVRDFARLDADTVRIGNQKINIPARLGSARRLDELVIHAGEKLVITPRVEGLNGFLSSLGSRDFLPKALDGKTFTVQIPPVVNASYQVAGGSRFTLLRTVAPEITVPEGISLEEVRRALLSVPVLPERMRDTLASVYRWENTLLIPDFMIEKGGASVPEEVMVNGNRGVFIRQEWAMPEPTQYDNHRLGAPVPPSLQDDGTASPKSFSVSVPGEASPPPLQERGTATRLRGILIWPQGSVWNALEGPFTLDEALALAAELK
ncbi:MAG: zf-HC2 domain-containing protein [Bacillota bacterium]|nr:zf-HC2 domain-containing protein [Bacillota bacterium]